MLEVIAFPVEDLQVFHRNPRRGDVRAIAASLEAQGQYRPIVVNVGSLTGRPNEILAGNHTFLAACSLGWATVQATTVDVDEATAHRIVLADNRLADLGAYDDADLAAAMAAAGALDGTGYTSGDLDALLASLDEPVSLTDPDDVPSRPDAADAVSGVGDVWHLGPHRLLVGSSGDLDAVRGAIPEGVEFECVWTDPPYGVEYVGGTGLSIQNDGAEDAIAVSVAFLEVAVEVCRDGAPVYVAHSDVLRVPLQAAMDRLGIRYRQTLMWVKDRFVLSRADYHYQSEPILEGEVDRDFEPIAYGFTAGGEGRLGRGGPRWFGDNRSSTVFDVRRPSRSAEHPTMKPVELVERMLVNSCPPGGWVLDGFAGSGTTLIAAHRLGRRAMVVELDPTYADVICRRWQEHTGVVPVRNGQRVDFSEVVNA
ncbi:DNA modification methylase [Microbacterium sp. SORGH_AS 505]|uniref:DNA modification methylase n=1 Tax=Microbacterium sp. SORGH_AS_0505 TaxID=3041770 RepID=UPI0027881643|nr:DNA methyltransferase [Microbacterium sp. SORGH_AS_0505]MDQ1127575.1 DNA modification methylase [Microbacterium sp. SORGH_AS_0505]